MGSDKTKLVRCQKEGAFVTLIIRQRAEEQLEELEQKMQVWFPCFCREVPMSLEELFITEMEASGYDIRKVLR